MAYIAASAGFTGNSSFTFASVMEGDLIVFYEAQSPKVRASAALHVLLSGGTLRKDFVHPPLSRAISHLQSVFEMLRGDIVVEDYQRIVLASAISRCFRLTIALLEHDNPLFIRGATLDDVRSRMLGSPELYWAAAEAVVRVCAQGSDGMSLVTHRDRPCDTPPWAFWLARLVGHFLRLSRTGHPGVSFSAMMRSQRADSADPGVDGVAMVNRWKAAHARRLATASIDQCDEAALWARKDTTVTNPERKFYVEGLGHFRLPSGMLAGRPPIEPVVPVAPVEVVPVAARPTGRNEPMAERSGVFPVRRDITFRRRVAGHDADRAFQRWQDNRVEGVLAENQMRASEFAMNANKGRY